MSTPHPKLQITTRVPLPAYLSPKLVVDTLHRYEPLIEANPHLQTFERRKVGIEEVVDDPFFTNDGDHLQAFTTYQRIAIIPGVGSWATKDIVVPCIFQSFANGTRCRADAQGVRIWSTYEVRRHDGGGSPTAEGVPAPVPETGGQEGWELVETAEVECGSFVRPFVKRSFASSHQEVLHRLADNIVQAFHHRHSHSHSAQSTVER